MKHLSLQRLLLFTAIFFLGLATSAQGTKKILMKCYDTFGTYLLTDSIVQPKEECFFLVPPQIPFYTCKTYDPKGSSACLVGGELNVEYVANGFTGFDSLTQQPLEINENMSFVISEVRDGKIFLWTAKDAESVVSMIPQKEATHTPDETWVIKKDFAGWQVYNEAKGLYIIGISQKGELLVGEEPTAMGLKTSGVTGEAWQMTDLETQRTYSFVPHHYAVRPYFRLTENFVDDKDNPLKESCENYVEAGEKLAAKAEKIKDFSYKSWRLDGEEVETTTEMPNMIAHHTIDYVYRRVTAVSTLTDVARQHVPVDLNGRKVSPNYRGLVIINGRVQWQ